MFAKILITVLIVTGAMVLLAELTSFWDHRYALGNLIFTVTVALIILWFTMGLYQLWK